MKMKITYFFERMFFQPRWYHRLMSFILLPISIFYGALMFFRRTLTYRKTLGIPIVSVGNLIVGGSGKTPFCMALASRYKDVAIVSRGYGRKSKGLIEVSRQGHIFCTVEDSGDEAMLMAMSLPYASVIVSEDREKAILLAKKQGCRYIILDDGFNRVALEKFEILLEPARVANTFPFPSGAYREFYFTQNRADMVLKEDVNFEREISFENLCERMVLLTAISNPHRLKRFLPQGIVHKVYLEDHAYFDTEVLDSLLLEHRADSFLITQKDAVKMQTFKYPVSLMKLKLHIKEDIFEKIDYYLENEEGF